MVTLPSYAEFAGSPPAAYCHEVSPPARIRKSSSVAPFFGVASLFAAGLGGCAHSLPPSVTKAPDLCKETPFCLPAGELSTLLRDAPFTVRAAEAVGQGDVHSQRLLIVLPGGQVVRIKWKAAPPGGDGPNSSPRRELAAYEVQKLFLDEADYVVPPVAARCTPEAVRDLHLQGETKPTFSGSSCLLGLASYWLEGVETLKGVSKERFAQDPLYRRRLALLNILTYLIDHHDTKPANFTIEREGDPHAFSVDNGMAFSGWLTPGTWFLRSWREMIVDAVPMDAVARLRRVQRSDLHRLAVIAQYRVAAGALEPMAPGAPFSEEDGLDKGIRRRGDVVQLGLTRSEIEDMRRRLLVLLDHVESGALKTF